METGGALLPRVGLLSRDRRTECSSKEKEPEKQFTLNFLRIRRTCRLYRMVNHSPAIDCEAKAVDQSTKDK